MRLSLEGAVVGIGWLYVPGWGWWWDRWRSCDVVGRMVCNG
jgi:hypothetical protein